MNIIINTDNHIKGSEELKTRFTEEITKKLDRFEEWLTRVEVFFVDENKAKTSPDDKRCKVEVRVKNQDAFAVSHNAPTLHLALAGALDKMKSALNTKIGKTQNY